MTGRLLARLLPLLLCGCFSLQARRWHAEALDRIHVQDSLQILGYPQATVHLVALGNRKEGLFRIAQGGDTLVLRCGDWNWAGGMSLEEQTRSQRDLLEVGQDSLDLFFATRAQGFVPLETQDGSPANALILLPAPAGPAVEPRGILFRRRGELRTRSLSVSCQSCRAARRRNVRDLSKPALVLDVATSPVQAIAWVVGQPFRYLFFLLAGCGGPGCH